MGEHVNTKKDTSKHHKAGFSEGRDVRLERARRTSFKSYVQNLEEGLLEEEMATNDFVLERFDAEAGGWLAVESFITEDEADYAEYKLHEETGARYRVSKA